MSTMDLLIACWRGSLIPLLCRDVMVSVGGDPLRLCCNVGALVAALKKLL